MRGYDANIIFSDETGLSSEKSYNAQKSQSDLEKNWMMMLSTPSTTTGHWYTLLQISKDPNILNISFDLICPECQKLPAHLMVQCTCVKVRGNPNKSRDVRKSGSKSTTGVEARLKETFGHVGTPRTGYYPKQVIDHLFSASCRVSGFYIPKFFFACFDPNAGDKNHTACITGYIDDHWNTVICGIDTKQTLEIDEFLGFFCSNLKLLNDTFRRDTNVPILAIVESQSSWNGDMVSHHINFLIREKKMTEFSNILFLSDKQKQKHGKMRCGVNINSQRLNEMTYRLSAALGCGGIKIHNDWTTASVNGDRAIFDEFEAQLRRFKHFEEGSNSGWKPNGTRQKNNTGKEGVLNDDISDCLHMAVAWPYWFLWNDEYLEQRRLLGIQIFSMIRK